MLYEIDQSGKVEETQRNTILALANDHIYTVLIPAKVKRRLQEDFRRFGQPKEYTIVTFVAGVSLLLKLQKQKFINVVLDIEYKGKDRLIGRKLSALLKQEKVEALIEFRSVGRSKSPSHQVAIDTLRGKRKPSKTLTYGQLLAEIKMTEIPVRD